MRILSPLILGAVLLWSLPAFALDEIYSPNVEPGELSLEYNGSRTFDTHSDKDNAQEHELVLEYGLSNRMTVEGSLGYEKEPDGDLQLDHYEVEGRWQFAEQGQNWVDSGLLAAFGAAAHNADPNTLEIKLLLEKDIGRFTSRANIGFEQEVGSNSSGGPDYAFLWSTRYRYSEYVQPGFEMQSDLGQGRTLRHFDQQENYIGPAVYGHVLGNIKYEAAVLGGVSDAASNVAVRGLLEYEIHF